MKSTGKRFEENFRKSIPPTIFYYRFKDSSNNWNRGDGIRFAPSNICDCMLFDGRMLYLLELKSTKGKSLSFNNIREHQIDDLLEASKFKNVVCGFIIELSDLKCAFYMPIIDFKTLLDNSNRKSLSLEEMSEKGIEIDYKVLRTNCRLDIEKLLGEI